MAPYFDLKNRPTALFALVFCFALGLLMFALLWSVSGSISAGVFGLLLAASVAGLVLLATRQPVA